MEFETERRRGEREIEEFEEEYMPTPVEFEEESPIELLIEKLDEMSEEEKQDLSDELLYFVTSSDAKLSDVEKNAFMALIKGHLVGYVFRNALETCMRIDAGETRRIIKKYS